MATSLARQLQQLAIPGQPSLKQLASTKRPSFLFDAKEAANMDIETVYALGTNGLEELISIDGSFAEFERTLFKGSCQHYERAVQMKAAVEDVDRLVSAFLRKLSPYFLLKPAHKCIEWLVRVFQVHAYNVDAVMECILPYYETKVFARMLQLLPLKSDTSPWHWLRPTQKGASPLSRLTLVKRCVMERSFFHFVNELLPKSLEANRESPPNVLRTLTAFWSSTVIAVMDACSVSEDLVTELLQYMLGGLKSHNLDYRASAYMVIGKLVTKVTLEEKLCSSLLDAITKNMGADLLTERVCCMGVVCQTQQVQWLSKRTLKHICKSPSVVAVLADMCGKVGVSQLICCLLSSLVKNLLSGGDEALGMTEELLSEVQLEEEIVQKLIKQLFDHYLEKTRSGGVDEKSQQTIARMAQSLNSKYPKMVDKALQREVSLVKASPIGRQGSGKGSKEEDHIQLLHEFVAFTLPQSHNQVLPDLQSTLALSIYHPDPGVRSIAVRHLTSAIQQTSTYDREFSSSSLSARLEDDCPEVVLAVLELEPAALLRCVTAESLVAGLLKVLGRRPSKGWEGSILHAVHVLSSQPLCDALPERVEDVVMAVLPLLIPDYHGNQLAMGVAQALAESSLGKNHPLLGVLASCLSSGVWKEGCSRDARRDPHLLGRTSAAVIHCLSQQMSLMDPSRAETLVSKLIGAVSNTPSLEGKACCVYLSLLGVAVATMAGEVRLRIAHFVLEHVYTWLPTLESVDSAVEHSLSPFELSSVFYYVSQRHPTWSMVQCFMLVWLLKTVIDSVSIPGNMENAMWLTVADIKDHYYGFLLAMFTSLTTCVERFKGQVIQNVCKSLLQHFIQRHLAGRGSLLRFLAMIWTAPVVGVVGDVVEGGGSDVVRSQRISARVQIHSLNMAVAYLRSAGATQVLTLAMSSCPVVPSLLVSLVSPFKEVREAALHCLVLIHEAAVQLAPPDLHQCRTNTPFLHLVGAIVDSSLAVGADPAILYQLVARLLTAPVAMETEVPRVEQTPSKGRKTRKSRVEPEVVSTLSVADSILASLVSHIVDMDAPPYVQLALLRVLQDVESETKLTGLLPLLSKLIGRVLLKPPTAVTTETGTAVFPLNSYEGLTLQMLVWCYSPTTASTLRISEEPFELFMKMLGCPSPVASNISPPQDLVLKQLTHEFFVKLEADTLQHLLHYLIELMLDSQRAKVITMVKQAVSQVPMTTELVIHFLDLYEQQLKPPPTPSKKPRLRNAKSLNVAVEWKEDASRTWRRLTALLEFIQHRCASFRDCHLLVPHLFNIISRNLEEEEARRVSLEYTVQLVLTALLNLCNYLQSQGNIRDLLPETQFNVELVVQCVRMSSNPQTHNHALMLLGSAATIFPGRVLHNIMPIFTFMGANMARKDDMYSFLVITKTMDSVIPAIIKSGVSDLLPDHTHRTASNKRSPPLASADEIVTEIIRLFVDATPHVPAHRRLPLLSHLVTTLGPHQYLGVTLGLLCTKHVGQAALVEQTPKEALIETSFFVALAQEFSAQIQAAAILRLLEYVAVLPEEKPSSVALLRQLGSHVNSLFNVASHTPEDLRQFKYCVLSLTLTLTSHKSFMQKVMSLDAEGHAAMENTVLKLLQCLLKYIAVINKARSSCDSSMAKFWESLLRKLYGIIDKVVSLLSVESFLQISCQLISETSGDIQRKSLDMLTAKIEKGEVKLTTEHDAGLLAVMGILLRLVGDSSVPSMTRQSSLYALKVLTKKLGSRHGEEFVKVCRAVLTLLTGEDIGDQVYASGLLCVAELMRVLGPHLIPFLPQLMGCVLKYIGNIQDGRELLHVSAVTTLSVYVKSLPKFMSSYAAEMIEKLCAPNLLNTDKERMQVKEEASAVRELVAKSIPPRTLLPAYQKTYLQLTTLRGKESTAALLGMLRTTIACLGKDDVKSHNQALVDIFMTVLDYRASHAKEPIEEVSPVENVCLEGFTELMVKLSEAAFRPLFLKLLDWATSSTAPRDRIITFYHLADTVADKLKSLFLLFAGHILKNVTSVLDKNNLEVGGPDQLLFHGGEDGDCDEKASKGCCLLTHVIGTLHKCFLYDRGSFVTKERFETLLLPLTNQISNQLGGSKQYQDRVESQLVPCLAQFAVAAGKDSLWKPLNYQILLKTRHSDVNVRFAALKVLQEMYAKLGEEFLVLLPEIIPFLAELMEDESVEIEQQTQAVIRVIEGVMGESIQQYF